MQRIWLDCGSVRVIETKDRGGKEDGNGALAARWRRADCVSNMRELVGVGRMMAVREKDRVKNTMLEIGPQSPHESQGRCLMAEQVDWR